MNSDPQIEFLPESKINQSDNYINFKLIIIGDTGVGKSSVLKRAVKNIFDENYQATIGFEFLLMHFKVNDLKLKLQIWDTCGQEMYRSLVQGFYHNSSLRQHTEKDLPVFIIGNKNDLERKVTQEEVKNFKNTNDIVYFAECSAKNGYNVKEIFFEAAKYLYQMYKKFNNQDKAPTAKRLKLEKNDNDDANNDKKKKKKCC